uniref:Si:dkeyp-69b9.3 n=1 Tax=Echeneis naucrates TaxID=173247 RepID=A0A665VUX4_ECHNA
MFCFQSGLTLLPATESIRQPMSVTFGESNFMATTGRPTRPPSPVCSSSLNYNHPPRPRKPRDTKPKMRKLKYHQYIPPDQRGGSANGDPATSHHLSQQQVFLQLQILQNQQQQQQHGDTRDFVKTSGAMPLNPQPVPATTNHTPMGTNPASKPELLPANLVDLTVSELRQQLRKRGLPVSGTKPALLQRLRPFQLPHACITPAPLCQLGASVEPLTPCPLLPPSLSPGSSSRTLNGVTNRLINSASVNLPGEQCGLTNTVFLAPASTASGTPSPSLPMSSSSPLQCVTPWRTENEQQQQELSVELEMRERIRSRPRDRSTNTGNEVTTHRPYSHHLPPNLCLLSNQVFCFQPCDVIGQDFELPVQITASPVQTLPGVRSLEEELQEAIQKAQMDPRQSIDDILDEPITYFKWYSYIFHSLMLFTSSFLGPVNVSDHKSSSHTAPGPSPPTPPLPPQADLSQTSQQHTRDDSFLPSPLCSSLLLELPPSPAVINPNQVIPAPPPPPICTSPLPSTGKSRKRRAPTPFDPADWLETLTSGLRPLTPPIAPFVESDFTLDSDLNVNRVLDLMIEQW